MIIILVLYNNISACADSRVILNLRVRTICGRKIILYIVHLDNSVFEITASERSTKKI